MVDLFRLKTSRNVLRLCVHTAMLLETKNPHHRDSLIVFDEPSHTYTINGDSDYMSATTFVHSNFGEFDEDLIIGRMMSSKNWTSNKYYGMTAEEIKAAWELNRNQAADAGTKMHAQIEDFYNGLFDLATLPATIEMNAFRSFHADFMLEQGLVPFRTEWRVFHEELRIAGTIDMTYIDKEGNLYIVDWKRCRHIKDQVDDRFKPDVSKNPGLVSFYDTNYFHYKLQLNLYKHIIETKYGMHVNELSLVNLHPEKVTSGVQSDYQYFDVPIMTSSEIQSLYTWRKGLSNSENVVVVG